MAFQSLQKVFGTVQSQLNRREQQQFQQLVRCWVAVVGPDVALQTRPLRLYRDVLSVATASPAWAQNLVFERQRILAKLNSQLPFQIADIRFSAAQWHEPQSGATFPGDRAQAELWRSHPSRLPDSTVQRMETLNVKLRSTAESVTDPMVAFQRWARLMQARSQQLPLCPECQCPTPTSELQRWQMCSICIAQRW